MATTPPLEEPSRPSAASAPGRSRSGFGALALLACAACSGAEGAPAGAAGAGGAVGGSAGVGGAAGASGAAGGSAGEAGAAGSGGGAASGGTSSGGAAGTGGGSGSGGAGGAAGTGGACVEGTACAPILIDTLPYADSRDTTAAPSDAVDSYACAPGTDESGGEWFYQVTLTERGLLTAEVADGTGVDVDLHLLGSTDPADCRARDDLTVSHVLDAGTYVIVVDTWVDGTGTELPGPYDLTVSLTPLAGGNCATVAMDLRMFWASCAAGVDCFEDVWTDGNTYTFLRLPTVGQVVKEAHLVTVAETFPSGWPTSFTDGIQNHYTVSQAATGYVTARTEPWAPAGEGGSEYGQGSTGAPLPVLDEAWYVNMYWRDRPARGTRLIIQHPVTGQAVVASGGYETGPGDNTAIGGVAEEIHDYLGTGHRDELIIGYAADQTLPLGPIVCQ